MRRIVFALLGLLTAVTPSSAERPRDRANLSLSVVTAEDVKAEIDFGREVAASVLAKYPLYNNDKATRYVNLVGKSLARNAARPELEFKFGIIDADAVTAISAPGGYIFISSGALEAMDDEAELAGVLAHEIIHTSQRHIVKELNIKGADSTAAAGMSHLIGGATESVGVTLRTAMSGALNILFEKGYKRDDEIEADSLGTVLLSTTGYEPTALKRYFEKLKAAKNTGTESMEKIHQPFEARTGLVDKIIADNGLPEKGFVGRDRFSANVEIKKR
ncbi:MAG: M48 family metalloprotease [Nitrospinae bacterium]|nr:M48 family metalloprotease [Nitrospinota bacterium]